MSGPFGSSQLMYASGEDAFTIDQSLRSSRAGPNNLSRTPTTGGHRQKWVFSCWIKRSQVSGNTEAIFSTPGDYIVFNSNSKLNWAFNTESDGNLVTTQVFRDPNAWMHLLFVHDTTQATASNRALIYVNGVRITAFDTETYPAEDRNGNFNHTNEHNLIEYQAYNEHGLNGYIAEVHFIDKAGSGSEWFTNNSGSASSTLNINTFGETGDYGEWKPKEVSGLTYGTNGFYLPFKQDYTVEGFSATVYKGNGANRYIGGVGFQPDLTWIKMRDGTDEHRIMDSVRGIPFSVKTTTAAEDNDEVTGLTARNPDGFSLGSSGAYNNASNKFVAWNWDMGTYPDPHQITVNGGAKLSTTQEKTGISSLYFDGTGDYLSLAASDDWNFGTGDFTIEFWVYYGAQQAGNGIMSCHQDTNNRWNISHGADNSCYFQVNLGGSSVISTQVGAAQATGSWRHIAIVKTSGNVQAYEDGTAFGSAVSCGTMPDLSATALEIGRHTTSYYLNGYLDEIRISSNARYSGNFTPSSSHFTRDSNTLLLMHCVGGNNSTAIVDDNGTDHNATGSINSQVRANPTYGQSIVSYTGNSSTNQTVGHGLSSTPDIIIIKSRDDASAYWSVINPRRVSAADPNILYLNDTMAEADSTNIMGDNLPTSSVFGVDDYDGTNKNGDDFIAYCWHSVTGYSSIGTFTGNGSATGPVVTCGFAPAFVMIKGATVLDDWVIYDNVRQPSFQPARGIIYANQSAAEDVSNSTWFTLSSTGFQYNATGTGFNVDGQTYVYMAFADKREYAYWLDDSGNNNDWTSNNLTESDISVDSPTNNFPTLNPLAKDSNITLSEGNLKASGTGTWTGGRATFAIPKTGKWYWEWCVGVTDTQYYNTGIDREGIADPYYQWYKHAATYAGAYDGTFMYGYSSQSGTTTAHSAGDIVGWTADDGEIKVYLNNVLKITFSQNLSAIGNDYFPAYSSIASGDVIANFGQDSSFAGNKTAQGNQDANSIGDFYYTPPTDFLALCTSNLPAVAVIPSEYFNTILYDDGAGAKTGVGFQPDLVWLKARGSESTGYEHKVTDAVRGVTKAFVTNTNAAETTDSTGLTAFGADGFTVGSDSDYADTTGDGIVAWNWKAGNAISGTGDFTQGTRPSTCSRDVDAGFSIVSYTGDGVYATTVGHGLSKAPEVMINKERNNNQEWIVRLFGIPAFSADADAVGILEGTSKLIAYNVLGYYFRGSGGNPTSTLFGLSQVGEVNQSDVGYIVYCWHSVDGFSKFGSYIGNGSTDGTFVYLGFRPARVMWKNATDNGTAWVIMDNKRDTYNPNNDALVANDDVDEEEDYAVDFLSNGLKFRNTSSWANLNGKTYFFMAFAETPFKYSNAK